MAEVKMNADVAKKYRFKGKHSAMRYVLPSNKIIDLSTASVAEVDEVMKNGWNVLEAIPAAATTNSTPSEDGGTGKKK